MHINKHKRQETQRIFLGETIKEKPRKFLRDIMSTNGSSKNQKTENMISTAVLSLSLERASPLSLMRPNE